MRVLHLGKFDALGGIERHVRSLVTGLVATGEVDAVNLISNGCARFSEDRQYGYLTVRAPSWGTALSLALSPTLPMHARRLHHEHDFDLVHLHFPDPLGHLTALALPRKVKRIISWHSDIVRQQRALRAYRPLLRPFVRDADALIVATPQHLSGSLQIPAGKPEQVRQVIPYGFEPAQMQWGPAAEARALQLRAARRPLVFALGRHVYYKGFDVLLHAMQHVDALLLLGGTGPLTAKLKAQATQIGVADRVKFVGFIPEEELVAYYQASEVFVMPSSDRSEQFGLVQLEAMHCGKPVIATRLGTGVEYVTIDGETGLLVPPSDPHALASALRRLLESHDLRESMGRAGRKRVKELFSIRSMVDQTIDVYRKAMDAPLIA